MMSIIHIDLQQEPLQMILAVKKSIGEGEIHHNFMDKDIITKGKNITTAMASTKMQSLGFLRSSFLVLMALVILMYIKIRRLSVNKYLRSMRSKMSISLS